MHDLISRQDAIVAVSRGCEECRGIYARCEANLLALQSAQPERLTDDDFETIRIHLNAYKEMLCNQCRWKEANEYQNLINRFMAFASAQPEIIRCKECKYWESDYGYCHEQGVEGLKPDDYCSYAERREDECTD